ncbi:phage tail tape measure protein, partial [Enterococcus faecium]
GDNAKGKLKELSSAAESLQITLGNALLPVVKDVSTWLTEVTRGVDKWAEAHPGLVRVLTIAGAAVGALAAAGAPLLLAMASINSMMAMTRYGMTAFGAISQLTAVRMGLVTAAQWALNTAILANPITWIIVAV